MKIGDIVTLTHDTKCEYNWWQLKKGLYGRILYIDDDIVTLDYQVADCECVYVRAQYLTPGKPPSHNEICAAIDRTIQDRGTGYDAFSGAVSNAYEQLNDDEEGDKYHFLTVTPEVLIFVFNALPTHLKDLAINNYTADIGNFEFCSYVEATLSAPENRHFLTSLKHI